jgi:hypothetical protein
LGRRVGLERATKQAVPKRGSRVGGSKKGSGPRAGSLDGDGALLYSQGHIDSGSTRAECLAVSLRLRSHARARRQLGFRLSAGLTERTLSSDQEPWRGRSKVFSKVEDVQGRRSLERVLVSWVPENDESDEQGQEGYYRRRRSWMLPRVLPKFVRLLAKAIWGARGGATSSSSVIRAPLCGGRKQLGLPEHQPVISLHPVSQMIRVGQVFSTAGRSSATHQVVRVEALCFRCTFKGRL